MKKLFNPTRQLPSNGFKKKKTFKGIPFIKLLVLLLLFSIKTIYAQTNYDSLKTNFQSTNSPSIFLSAGLGIGTPGLAGNIQLNVEAKHRNTFTIGFNTLSYGTKEISTPFIQLGLARKSSKSFTNWGIGPSITIVAIYEPTMGLAPHSEIIKERKYAPGIHLTYQVLFAGKYFGIGISPYADLNITNPHAGIILILALGRINKKID